MAREIERVVVLGANGAMGAGSGEVFAAAGIHTTFLARTRDKAEKGRARAEKMAKSTAISKYIDVGTYDDDFDRVVAEADLVFEAVAENMDLKRQYMARIDKVRKPGSIVATVSSGLSIAGMVAECSEDLRKHFLGMHLFNPPNVIVGCELVPHAGTDAQVTAFVESLLADGLGRQVVRTADLPAFAGNRVGFKLLNEAAQLAEEYGVGYIDALIGPHTGRAMAPLVTIDFVGWDVHKAIVDNLYANTNDEGHDCLKMPAYMDALVEAGHLGNKTPDKGGFFRKDATLDAKTASYAVAATPVPELAQKMKAAHRIGRYQDAIELMCETTSPDATLMRKVILGYVSYALGRVGDVVEKVSDVDRIMAFGFNWAPPGLLADMIGPRRCVGLLDKANIAVPKVLTEAAEKSERLWVQPNVDTGRFFFGS